MRICLYGGPGCGKSTLAAKIFSHLKSENYSVELIHEFIKQWAYENKPVKSFDQSYIFVNQLRLEDLVIQNSIDHLVTDSPLYLQVCYGQKRNYPLSQSLMDHCDFFEEKYPALNIFLDRKDIEYQPHGRYENYEEALEMDDMILDFMKDNIKNFTVFKSKESDAIINFIKESIK